MTPSEGLPIDARATLQAALGGTPKKLEPTAQTEQKPRVPAQVAPAEKLSDWEAQLAALKGVPNFISGPEIRAEIVALERKIAAATNQKPEVPDQAPPAQTAEKQRA